MSDHDSTDQLPRTRTTRRIIVIGAAIAMIVVIVLGWGTSRGWFAGQSAAGAPGGAAAGVTQEVEPPNADPERPAPAPLDIPRPNPKPVAGKAASEQAASAATDALLAASNKVLQRADGGVAGLGFIATGFVRGELEALAAERADLGYTQVGEAKITSKKVVSVDLAASPPTVVLEVCIDTSKIDIVDSNGMSLKGLLYNPGVPVKHIYGAQHVDGVWKIADHDIPDNSPCA